MNDDGQELLRRAEVTLLEVGADVWTEQSDAYPQIVAAVPRGGLVVLDVATSNASDSMVDLNRKVANLRGSLPSIDRIPVARRLIDVTVGTGHGSVLGKADVYKESWLKGLAVQELESRVVESLKAFFAPRLSIELPVRRPMEDADAVNRAVRRVELDAQQAEIARRQVDGMLAISGPPGSGKTLVLCARANWLATEHPDWDIRILCYNRMLVPYLAALTAGCRNIRVSTVGKFSASVGVRMSLDDPLQALKDLANARRKGLGPMIDAVLIDEWQDFYPAWTALAELVLRPQRGGMVVAGDPKQALYHDSGMSEAASLPTEAVVLGRPYRSTRQILDVTSALSDALHVEGRENAFDGEPVDLVWATNADEQAGAIARDVRLLLESGARLRQDIGVLVTRKWTMGRIAGALSEAGVPCRVVYPSQAEDTDFAESTVKILTVHSAKGLEFDVVFLAGLEQLPSPDGTDDVDRHGRTGYVGATRARDQLVLSYSKDNAYLERIRGLPETTLRNWVWPDDYPEA